jgi:hypothetical protein
MDCNIQWDSPYGNTKHEDYMTSSDYLGYGRKKLISYWFFSLNNYGL